MTESSQNRRRLARKAFELTVRYALAMIPVYGPLAALSLELLGLVREELSNDRPMTRKEVLALLLELSQAELNDIVGAEMSSPAGKSATASLGPAERLRLQRALENLPSQLDKLMAEAEADERAAKRDKEIKEITETREREEEKQRNIAKNRSDLTRAMQERDWYRANVAAQRLMRLGVRDADVRRAEKFSYRRRKSTAMGGLVYAGQAFAWLVPFFILAVILGGTLHNLVAAAAMVGLYAMFLGLSTWSKAPLAFRTAVVVVGIAAIVGLWSYVSLQLP